MLSHGATLLGHRDTHEVGRYENTKMTIYIPRREAWNRVLLVALRRSQSAGTGFQTHETADMSFKPPSLGQLVMEALKSS